MSENEFFEDGVWEDDDIINRILESNQKNCDGARYLWLANDVNNLPDFHWPQKGPEGTETPVDREWRSPYIGKDIQDVAEVIRNVPKPRKPLCKTYFVLFDRPQYEQKDKLLVCKLVNAGVQAIPCDTWHVAAFLVGHERDEWEERWDDWQEDGRGL